MDKKINNFGNIKIYENFELAKFSSFRIGGKARFAAFPKNSDELISLIDTATKSGIRNIVIGNASNILFDSGYIDALIIFTRDMKSCKIEETKIIAECGCSLSALSVAARNASLSGLEFAYGIPGTLGGAVYMNAGAYGGEMKDVLVECRHIDSDGNLGSLKGDELGLAYRTSAYEHNGFIITTLVMKLKKGDKAEIKARMQELLQRRKDKQPLEFPSAGSTFKRPEGHFAGGLIEECGLKGCSVGGAQVSEKHAGFIINKGGATAQDVLDLIKYVQDRVFEEKGIHLEPEVRLITVG